MKVFCTLTLCALALTISAAPKKLAPIISTGAGGRLVYDVDEAGDRVPDFSTCGYAGQEQAVPNASVRVVVAPVAGDETARIQKALDYAGSLTPDASGLRGAVLLLKGEHHIFGQLRITQSGVILRGQGMGDDGTTLMAEGLDRRTLIRLLGRDDASTISNANWVVGSPRVPVA